MSFTEDLWERIRPLFARILEHPFLQGLTDGSLPEPAFRFYVVQDALYLRDFARGLALLAGRAPEDGWVVTFSDHARTAIVVERELHETFFRAWGLTDEEVYSTPPAPVNLLYTSYLIRVAYERPFHEALGAFLPCYWIYWEVGKHLESRGSPSPLYRRWIDTYAGEEYGAVVRQVIELTDRLAQDLTPAQREAVKEHFVITSRLEYMFWDMGYRREGWPL